MQAALTTMMNVILHVVAQIVKAEFVIGTVGDIGRVGLNFLVIGLLTVNGTNRHP